MASRESSPCSDKDTFLAPACMQQGRKIVIDVEMAVELFKTHKDGNN